MDLSWVAVGTKDEIDRENWSHLHSYKKANATVAVKVVINNNSNFYDYTHKKTKHNLNLITPFVKEVKEVKKIKENKEIKKEIVQKENKVEEIEVCYKSNKNTNSGVTVYEI